MPGQQCARWPPWEDTPKVTHCSGDSCTDSVHTTRGDRSDLAGTDPIGFESFPVPARGQGGDVFYDDNTWLALAICRHHMLTGSDEAAGLSRRLLDFVLTGW